MLNGKVNKLETQRAKGELATLKAAQNARGVAGTDGLSGMSAQVALHAQGTASMQLTLPEQATLYTQALAVVQSDNTGRQAQDTPTGEGGPSAKRQRIAGPSLGDI